MTQTDISISLLNNNRLTSRKCHYREQQKSGRTIERKRGEEKIENPLKQGALSLHPFQLSFICLEDYISGGQLKTTNFLWWSFERPVHSSSCETNIESVVFKTKQCYWIFEYTSQSGPRAASLWSQNADQIKPVCYYIQTEVLKNFHLFWLW